MSERKEAAEDFCPCKRSCPRHGDCAACLAAHENKKIPPACKRGRHNKGTAPGE
ncbi:MAG: hypothetical protein PUE64_12100 [Firmicutes bacterium]|nr:hypothetical protein [Bacillota bacterium]